MRVPWKPSTKVKIKEQIGTGDPFLWWTVKKCLLGPHTPRSAKAAALLYKSTDSARTHHHSLIKVNLQTWGEGQWEEGLGLYLKLVSRKRDLQANRANGKWRCSPPLIPGVRGLRDPSPFTGERGGWAWRSPSPAPLQKAGDSCLLQHPSKAQSRAGAVPRPGAQTGGRRQAGLFLGEWQLEDLLQLRLLLAKPKLALLQLFGGELHG